MTVALGVHFNVANQALFQHAQDGIRRALAPGVSDQFFSADNLITWNRNLGFLQDERFMAAMRRHATDAIEQSIVWRTAVLCWFARWATAVAGDFLEIGCYKGTSARILYDVLDFAEERERRLWLYDLFEHRGGKPITPSRSMAQSSMRASSPDSLPVAMSPSSRGGCRTVSPMPFRTVRSPLSISILIRRRLRRGLCGPFCRD